MTDETTQSPSEGPSTYEEEHPATEQHSQPEAEGEDQDQQEADQHNDDQQDEEGDEERLARLDDEIATAEARIRALRRVVLAAAFNGKLTGRSSDAEVIEELAVV